MDEVITSFYGENLLNHPLYNKGSAFTDKEREDFGLHGLLPYGVMNADEQIVRAYENFSKKEDPIEKHLFLTQLQNTNEMLFYMLVDRHVKEMLPYIYTPTVGDVSLHFSNLYLHHRGLYLSYPLKDKMEEMIHNFPREDIRVIVVTDGQRILGLGDLGMGGMAIPVGKLALYTLFGGIHPAKTLPVLLDVGTDNETLLNSPSYLGWRHKRLSGEEYDQFIDQFVRHIKKRYPKVLLQWEDFGKLNASRLLEKYQDKVCSFNDDIQGTAAVVLAGILTAARKSCKSLRDERYLILGAGSAGMGICKKILFALMQEGMKKEEALRLFYVVDRKGLIHDKLENLDANQRLFAQPYNAIKPWISKGASSLSFLEVIKNIKPSVLIGVSGQAGIFSEEVIRTMVKGCSEPVIFPLSNPNSCCEALPEDIVRYTDGKAFIATGSPFPDVSYKGRSYSIAQCNNVYIFPGVGLGVLASECPKVTDKMFFNASRVLSDHSPLLQNKGELLFPSFQNLKEICSKIAMSVYETAIEENLVARCSKEAIQKKIEGLIWQPHYPLFKLKPRV